MAKSRTNSKSKLSKKSKGNVPKWAIAAVVVLVVAVAGYAIVRFSQAGTENIGERLSIRYAGLKGTRSTNQERFRCEGSTVSISQKGDKTICGLSRGQHATGFWYDDGPSGVDFSGGGVFGSNGLGSICADVWLGPNGTRAYISVEERPTYGEVKGGEKSNSSPQGRADRVCVNVDIAKAWLTDSSWLRNTGTLIGELKGDVLIARLYNASPANVPGGAVTVEKFYLLNDR